MKKTFSRLSPLLAALLAAVASTILFHAALASGHTLLSPDSQPFRFVGWLDEAFINLFGGRYEVPTFDTPLYWLFPLPLASTLSYILATALTALGAALYLRHWKCPPAAAVLGGLSLAFSGYHFTLFNAGHRGYFVMMAYAVFLLCALDSLLETGRWPYAVFAAVCAVSALRSQPDVFALWCGILAVYTLLRVILQTRATPRAERPRLFLRWGASLAVLLAVVALFGGPVIRYTLTDVVAGREAQIQDKSEVQSPESEAQGAESEVEDTTRWDFATSWSLPPAELAELACPNLRGYDSGNQKGPYWGSVGRDVHYAENGGQGFFNFRQHTLYLGAIPLLLALLAVAGVFGCNRKQANAVEAETTQSAPIIAFWAVVAVGALLLALGRYTPLYRLFYSLPMMSGIRGPLKFLHFTEVAVALLAGFGCARLLRDDARSMTARIAAFVGVAAALVLFIVSFIPPAGLDTALTALGIPTTATAPLRQLLLGIRARTMLLTALFFALGSAALFVRGFAKRIPVVVAWGLAALTLCDMMRAAAPYVNPVETHLFDMPNALVESLRKSGQLEASAWAGQAGGLEGYFPFTQSFYHHRLFPADLPSGMDASHPTIQALRRFQPEDTLRRWQFLGTRLVIVPIAQFNEMPKDTPQFSKLGTYALTQSGVVSAPAAQAQFGALVLRNWTANGSVFTRWETAANTDEAWAKLTDPSLDLGRKLVVAGPAPECPRATGLTPLAVKAKTIVGEVDGHRRHLVFETSDDSPEGLLFIRNLFGGYKEVVASVDGAPVDILPANILFRAVPVPAGKHTVEFRVPLHRGIAIAYGATALLLLAAAWMVLRPRRP